MPDDLNALVARLMQLAPADPGMMVKVIIPVGPVRREGDRLVYEAEWYEIPPTFFFGGPSPDPDTPREPPPPK